MPPRHALSAFAVWSGVYVSGATVFFIQITGTPGVHLFWVALMAWATGAGVYLLDRVKLKDAWLDPADQASRPAHHALLTARPAAVRAAAAVLLAGAMLIALNAAPPGHLALVEAIPLAAVIGVALYAARPRRARPRPKDLLAIKNAYTAGGITALAILLTLCWLPTWHRLGGMTVPGDDLTGDYFPGVAGPGIAGPGIAGPVWIFAAAVLWARVFVDASLCDIDDLDADARFATRTFAVAIGPARTRRAAIAARLLIAAALALVPVGPAPARTAWAAASAATAITLLLRHRDWRDYIDLSLGIEAACVTIYLAAAT